MNNNMLHISCTTVSNLQTTKWRSASHDTFRSFGTIWNQGLLNITQLATNIWLFTPQAQVLFTTIWLFTQQVPSIIYNSLIIYSTSISTQYYLQQFDYLLHKYPVLFTTIWLYLLHALLALLSFTNLPQPSRNHRRLGVTAAAGAGGAQHGIVMR